jgi:hypothetical protein
MMILLSSVIQSLLFLLVQVAPWSPLLEGRNKELEITKKYVVYISETQETVITQYGEMYSVIKAPNKKLIT